MDIEEKAARFALPFLLSVTESLGIPETGKIGGRGAFFRSTLRLCHESTICLWLDCRVKFQHLHHGF